MTPRARCGTVPSRCAPVAWLRATCAAPTRIRAARRQRAGIPRRPARVPVTGRWPRSISPTGARCSRSSADRSGWPFPRARRRSSRPRRAACRSLRATPSPARRRRLGTVVALAAALGAAAVALATGFSGSPPPAVAGPTPPRAPPARSSRWPPGPARARGGRAVARPVARAVPSPAPPPPPPPHRPDRRRRRLRLPWRRRRSIPRRRPCPSSRRHPRCDGRVPDWKR